MITGSFSLRGLFNHLTVRFLAFSLRLQKHSITTVHHDEKHDFFFPIHRKRLVQENRKSRGDSNNING